MDKHKFIQIPTELRLELVKLSKRGFNNGLFSGTDGNMSVFIRSSGIILITPSGMRYEDMNPEDIVAIDTMGNILEGHVKPSSEWRMHVSIYNARNDINAIVHTHSPYATAFAALRRSIPAVLSETLMFLGNNIECADFAPPGSHALGQNVCLCLPTGRYACLMANHGAVALGYDLSDAYTRAEYLESNASIYHKSLLIGVPFELSKQDSEL